MKFGMIRPGDKVIIGYEASDLGFVAEVVDTGVWYVSYHTGPFVRHFMPRWMAEERYAVLGKNVCRKPQGMCYCGFLHVKPHQLTGLPLYEAV